jgi:AraC-like DNA-binding protein
MEEAIQRFIAEMWDRYAEQLNLGELASSVFVSPFHFLRVFTRTTGVTPGRYLSAIRMYEAKRLLLTTPMRVSDIVTEVGYSSLGTFTTRFTQVVGITPSQYREPEVGELLIAVGPRFSRTPSLAVLDGAVVRAAEPGGASVVGTVALPPAAAPANVFVCLFRERVPQRGPVAYDALPNVGSARFAIRGTPAGDCTVIAVAEGQIDSEGPRILFGASPVLVTPGGAAVVHLRLRAPRPTDAPLAISLSTRVATAAARRDARAA